MFEELFSEPATALIIVHARFGECFFFRCRERHIPAHHFAITIGGKIRHHAGMGNVIRE